MYKYNKETLEFERVDIRKYVVIAALVFLCLGFGASQVKTVVVQGEKEIILKENDEFSRQKLISALKDFNIKHPEIVYAQFLLESDGFKSPKFRKLNNFMGMMISTTRPTTAIGEENGFAVFKNWRDCVIDYGFYQSSFLRGLNKDEYYRYLGQNYAEDPQYVNKVKNIVQRNNLEKTFK